MSRILWISNSLNSFTGYGVQTKLFVPRIINKYKHEIAVFGYYGVEGGMMNINGVTCYPKAMHPYGMDVVRAHATHWKADYVLSLMDAWVVQPSNIQPIPWVAYFPVDHDPMPPKVKESLQFANSRISMSKFGQEAAAKMGLDSYYVPHAVDTNLYKKIDRKEARERLNFPQCAYIVGTVAMNKGMPPRKNFAFMLEAFRNFKRNHPSAIYYLHTQLGAGQDGYGGMNLPELVDLLGMKVGKDVFFCDQYQQIIGFNEEYMALMYSALDVHMLVSAGEGFGIPIIESQACGCPNIVGGWTAMPELIHSGRIIEKKDAEAIYDGIASYNWFPHVGAVEDALEQEYKNPSSRVSARKGMVDNYEVELVMERHWKPALEAIDKELERVKERATVVNTARGVK
jgi:glycosyltransferase involved in cell wall biosynthesis